MIIYNKPSFISIQKTEEEQGISVKKLKKQYMYEDKKKGYIFVMKHKVDWKKNH